MTVAECGGFSGGGREEADDCVARRRALGGKLQASGTMDASSGTPQWALDVRVTGASLQDAGKIFGETWGPGTAAAEAKLTMSGYQSRGSGRVGERHIPFHLAKRRTAGCEPGEPNRWRGGAGHFDQLVGDGTIGDRALTLTDGSVTRAGRNGCCAGNDRVQPDCESDDGDAARAAADWREPGASVVH